jgi:FlaA1/EpsC-like NDP-sugar epimerase
LLKRRLFFLASDAALIAGSLYVSFWLRFDGAIPAVYAVNLKYYIAIALAIKLTILLVHDMYDVSWRFFGLKDLLKLFSGVTLSSLVLFLAAHFYKGSPFFPTLPRSVVLVDYLLTLGSIGVLRISKRAIIEYMGKSRKLRQGRARVLIVRARIPERHWPGHAVNKNRSTFPSACRRQPVQEGDEHPRHSGPGDEA